jgi:hypothetical protein
MKTKTESSSMIFVRSTAMGVLLSMFFFYAIHVLGEWQLENYRPDPETTSSVLLHNKCAILGNTHTLRPNTGISAIGDGIEEIKLTGSFMNLIDGHVPAMAILSLLLG